MDRLNTYRQIIRNTLKPYTRITYANVNGKVWVQYDGTEDGITDELVKAGIPKTDIVLGFHEPEVRPYTGYAIA